MALAEMQPHSIIMLAMPEKFFENTNVENDFLNALENDRVSF